MHHLLIKKIHTNTTHRVVQLPWPVGGSQHHHAVRAPRHPVKLHQKLGFEPPAGFVLRRGALGEDAVDLICSSMGAWVGGQLGEWVGSRVQAGKWVVGRVPAGWRQVG